MPFDIQSWKADIQTRLRGWKGRLDRAGTNSVYYFLAGTSFLPIVHAVQNGDYASLAVLGATLGTSVGTNLLANMVQKFKDKSDAEIAQELEREVQSTPELKKELDALLEAVDTLKQAEHVLSQEDKAWFARTIQEELKRVGSGMKYEAS